jgi:syntaxin-binding protein 1
MHRDGVPEGDKKRLYQHARLALHEMDAVDNLTYLGVNVSKVSCTESNGSVLRKADENVTCVCAGFWQEAETTI